MIKLNADLYPTLSETVIENLRRRNVITIVDFVSTDSIKLSNSTGLTYTDVLQIKQYILKQFGSIKKNALHFLAIERNNIISFGVTSLDELLKGGLYQGELCELCGPSSSGKTQLCLTIAANVASQSDVWYFDTKKDFSRLRYEQIMKARNFTQKMIEDALHNTKICQARSSQELILALRQLIIYYKQEQNDTYLRTKKTFLVIIDSLPAIIFKVIRNMQQIDFETIYELNDLAEVCRFLTKECQAVVITVNLISRWDSPEQTNSGNIKPTLGKYWSKIPATRLLIVRQFGESRKIYAWKGLRLIENSFCNVTINNIGVSSQ